MPTRSPDLDSSISELDRALSDEELLDAAATLASRHEAWASDND